MKHPLRRGVFLLILTLTTLGGVIGWRLSTSPPVPQNAGWKTYEQKTYGLTFEYPDSVVPTEVPTNGYFFVSASEPTTHIGYFSIEVPNDRNRAQRELSEYLTGPYPKKIPARGNNSERTVVERTINGLAGVEFYGYGGEGHSYDDMFIYVGKEHLWFIYLDPIIEGHITTYPEIGIPTPNREIYTRMRASIHIADAPTTTVPLANGTIIEWLGTYHAASSTEEWLNTYSSPAFGISFHYPTNYLLFTRNNAIILTPDIPTLQTIARAKEGSPGEGPGTMSFLFFSKPTGASFSLTEWLSLHAEYTNFSPVSDPTITLSTTTISGLPALSYRTSLGLYPFNYRVFIQGEQIVVAAASDIPDNDFDMVLSSITFAL